MEGIIQDANFVHDDEYVFEKFMEKVNKWRRENEANKDTVQVNAAFEALRKKLLGCECPGLETAGWKQVMQGAKVLIHFASYQTIERGKTDPQNLQDIFYTMFIDWFASGPASVHLEIIKSILRERNLAMEQYSRSQRDATLLKLLMAVTSPVNKKESTPDETFYENYYHNFMFFFRNAFDQTQLFPEDNMAIIIDFVFHLFIDYTDLDDNCVEILAQLAKKILQTCGKGWQGFSNIPKLKSYIKRFSDLALSPSFPRNKVVADVYHDSLTVLVTHLCKQEKVTLFLDDIFDLLEVLSNCKGEVRNVMRSFNRAAEIFYWRRRNEKVSLKNQPDAFVTVTRRFKTLVEAIPTIFLTDTCLISNVIDFMKNAFEDNTENTQHFLSLSIPLMKIQTKETLNASRNVLLTCGKINWKEQDHFLNDVIKAIETFKVPTGENKKAIMEEMVWVIKTVMLYTKKGKLLKKYGERLMHLSIQLLEMREEGLYGAAEEIAEHIEIADVKEKKDAIIDVMARIHALLKDESLLWSTSWALFGAVGDLIDSILKPIKDGNIFSDNDFEHFISICETCLERNGLNVDSECFSSHFSIYLKIIEYLLKWLTDTKKLNFVTKLIPLLTKKLDEKEEIVYNAVGCNLMKIATENAEILAPYLERLIKIYIEIESPLLINSIWQVYRESPVKMESQESFQALLSMLLIKSNDDDFSMLAMLMTEVAKKQAQLFNEKNMEDILNLARSVKATSQLSLIQIPREFCKRRPGVLVPYLDLLIDIDGADGADGADGGWSSYVLSTINDILSAMALFEKSISGSVADYFVTCVKMDRDKGDLITALNGLRLITNKYPDVIKPKRPEIEGLLIIDADCQGLRQMILDIIDGKTSEDMKKQLQVQQDAVTELVAKVEDVGDSVGTVVHQIHGQRQILDNLKDEIGGHDQLLGQVSENLQDTLIKVEEMDKKTLSNAPYWARDVSRLLNPLSDQDWRLLAQRLGYSVTDIQGWAQRTDSCMAMLNEWYTTHKTSEASKAILSHLEEMGRTDAALIVENAMKKAEDVVGEEEFEYASPPEIFISYQWGHQEKVKLLYGQLTKAGYDCWMDIGQMGGGDKLFEKIDQGLRACKLVVSCVSTKYARSPNCNREVSLAVGINKPIIPLLMEKCPWPPQGSMGPLFSESLYIQFYKPVNEVSRDEADWPTDKFQELLNQLKAKGLNPKEEKDEPHNTCNKETTNESRPKSALLDCTKTDHKETTNESRPKSALLDCTKTDHFHKKEIRPTSHTKHNKSKSCQIL